MANRLNLDGEDLQNQLVAMRSVLDHIGAYVFIKDLAGNYTYANELVCQLFNQPLEKIIGLDDSHFFSLEHSDDIKRNDRKVLDLGETIEAEERNIIAETGEALYFMTVKKPLRNDAGEIVGMFGVSTDITERKEMEIKLQNSNAMLDSILSNIDAFVYKKDRDFRFQYINSKTAEIFGLSEEEILGQSHSELFPESSQDFTKMDEEVFSTQQKQVGEEHFITPTGEKRYYWSTKIPLFDENGEMTSYIGFSTDVTELSELKLELEKQVQEEIANRLQQEERAVTDHLTGLYNRFKLSEEINVELRRTNRYHKEFCVIILDADNFKEVNDQLGHNAGDKVLKQIADVILKSIRKTDIAARWGGEEFLILCPETDLEGGVKLANKIQSEIAATTFPTNRIQTVSAGVSQYQVNDNVFDIVERADKALYKAKNAGRNQVCY
ncbi:diguanylate cyclase [Thalassotalea sp. M1531]|uniref:Diguanylate cyclase n=1 Tax=Thalassotalea algicola TaxID=2716224 RepID=A0A7Y0Q576_9GAMM|nr:diguanylate cyclase [Thalassotalea algicola]NMP30018.1 diguanylate cyclase [Thalassotalea algicola]